MEDDDSEEERVKKCRQKKAKSNQLNKLQQVLVIDFPSHASESTQSNIH